MEDKQRATLWRQSLRQHCQLDDEQWQWKARPHWLLSSKFGRIALFLKLRQVRPVAFSVWIDRARIDPLLDAMVDEVGLRRFAEPRSVPMQLLHILYALLPIHDAKLPHCSCHVTNVRGAWPWI